MSAVNESETIGMATPGMNAPTCVATTGSLWCNTRRLTPEAAVMAGTSMHRRRPTTRHGEIAASAAAMTGPAASSGSSSAVTPRAPDL